MTGGASSTAAVSRREVRWPSKVTRLRPFSKVRAMGRKHFRMRLSEMAMLVLRSKP